MNGFKEYKNAQLVREKTQRRIDSANNDIDLFNNLANVQDACLSVCLTTTKNVMILYAKDVIKRFPFLRTNGFNIPEIGIVAEFRNIEYLSVTENFSRHKSRNKWLRFIFGKAENSDAKADSYDNAISELLKNQEIEKQNCENRSISEKIRVIDRLRHLLVHNKEQIMQINHLSPDNLFIIYSGIKIFDLLANIIEEEVKNV